ncbi:MAG: hypothetical protein EPN43_07900, partial [Jatrophihabitans sp.]
MTAVLRPPRTAAWSIGAPRLLAPSATPCPAVDLPRLLGLLDTVHLRGRGGAGVLTADRLRAVAAAGDRRTAVVLNAVESEPASAKDRTLLQLNPHLVLDGALAVAGALGARSVTVAAKDRAALTCVDAAIRVRPDARGVRLHLTSGAYVEGEAR